MKVANIPSFTIQNGNIVLGTADISPGRATYAIPSVGLGCYMDSNTFTEKDVYDMCTTAIEVGYRHFDTATGYGNEKQVGDAIRDAIELSQAQPEVAGGPCKLSRKDFYITTKLANGDHHRVHDAFQESLDLLNCEYIDLYLLHWPQASTGVVDFSDINAKDMALPPDAHPTFVETWQEMEKLLATSKVKLIGVSNFSVKNLETLLGKCSIVPAMNQVELHPCLPQYDLQKYCEDKGILLTAYSPLGRSTAFFTEPLICNLAKEYQTTAAQIVLSWGVRRGTVVVPKSQSKERMEFNITLVDLSAEDMNKIGALHSQPGMHRSLVKFHADDGSVFGWKYEWLGWDMSKGGFVITNS
ncbi:aldo/keto reductase [Mycena maculata]|uniref:Aldo/keto reductase n=1 Tax=Mycena maculata TaxID=230809 RepID=A0AAD7MS47_9AGAR|nr:aldo/keto reductase [Mycena maculata]